VVEITAKQVFVFLDFLAGGGIPVPWSLLVGANLSGKTLFIGV
jgi:hypothetical protein